MTDEPKRLGLENFDIPAPPAPRVDRRVCMLPHPHGTEQHRAADHCDQHPAARYRAADPWLSGRCETCRREAREVNRREALLRMADTVAQQCDERFPVRFRDAAADHPDVLDWVRRFQQNPGDAPSLLIVGQTGVGKTWQAYGALRAAAVGYVSSWAAGTSADLVAKLRPQTGVDTEEVMHRYRTVDLLLIDDLGVAKNSEWVEEAVYRIIGSRYEQMRPTIYTTNLAVPKLREALGDRIASRLAETCTRVLIEGDDRRRRK